MKSFINVEDGSHLTDISPVLTCIRTLNESEAIWNKSRSHYLKSLSLKQLRTETDVPREDGFVFAVSLRDGSCLYTSNAIVDHLGYPKDMLVGQCIMNFLFHKDHITFANHLTQGLNACFIQGKRDDSHLVVNSFFCRLRVYQGLKFGYSVSNKKPQYKPFKITLHLKELIVDDLCVEKPAATLCVKASATQVTSAYSIPEEIPAMTSFSTRHTSSCHFSHVDASAIPYLGYLPQDMIGYSVFDFYHIDDMPQLKDIYELVIKEHGSSFRSKPYRFKVQNGCYIMLETEWSCFINPWSHKLEFVVGQHRVLKGPSDVAIFTPCEEEGNTMLDEIVKEGQRIEKEIKALLSQTIQTTSGIRAKRFCNKRKRDLASFVYSCVDEGYGGNHSKGKTEKGDNMDDQSNSDSDSVVMGDISPYREVNDSSISSETPPTLQRLRYQKNIERFFASLPKTYSNSSDESNKNEKFSSGEGDQGSSSGSGNGSNKESGNTSKDKSSSTSYEAKVQESISNSSKCTIALTTGDSGYGRSRRESLEKKGTHCSDQSREGSSEGAWKKNEDPSEKFSSCLALTKESLSVHNRMNHKHLKQNRCKNKSSTLSSWAPQKSGKHKKFNNVPTQTEVVNLEFGSGTSASDPRCASAVLSHMNVGSSPTPTSFFIPVMYMGSLPYYPLISTVQPPSGASHWQGNETTGALPSSFMPLMPSYSVSGEVTPRYPTPGFDPSSGISPQVSSLGPASTRSTTTTMASRTERFFEGCVSGPTEEKGLDLEQQQANTRSSYTRSSSFQSADDEEDMELETKKNTRALSTRTELSSEVAFRYQMKLPEVGDVLKKDMEILKSMQQPDFVNRQLQMLRDELEDATETQGERDFCLAESAMLGLLTEEHINEELEYREDCLLQLMCEDS